MKNLTYKLLPDYKYVLDYAPILIIRSSKFSG